MRKLFIVCSVLFFSILAQSQTTVTATLADPSGQALFGGSVTALFVPNPLATGVANVAGIPVSPTIVSATLDQNGAFSIVLTDNNTVTPTGSTWTFIVCPQATVPCTNIQGVTITGGSLDISTILNAQIPNIVVNMGDPPRRAAAYSDTEVINAMPGNSYYNLTNLQTRLCANVPCQGTSWQAINAGSSPVIPPPLTVPFSATPVFDGSQAVTFEINMTGDITGPTIVNLTDNTQYDILGCQDAVGGHKWTWFTNVPLVGQLSGFSTLPNTCTLATGKFIAGTFYIKGYSANATPAQETLTVSLAGAGTGTVVSSPTGITCPGTCTGNFPVGTVITLTGTPASGSTLTSVAGGGCTTNPCQLTLTTATTVTYTFGGASTVFTVTAQLAGSGSGTLVSSPAGITCPGTCSMQVASGSNLSIIETPGTNSQFGGFSGCTVINGTTCNLTNITSNTTVTGTFNTVSAFSFVQSNSNITAANPMAITFPQAQQAGDLNVVVIGWNDKTQTINTVTDFAGNTYAQACGTVQHPSSNLSQAIWYATNIAAASSNIVTVSFSGIPTLPDLRVLEYKGAAASAVLDGACVSSTAASPQSLSYTIGFTNDLVVDANTTTGGVTSPVAGFVQRIFNTSTSDDVEDKLGVSSSISGSVSFTGGNISQMVAFKGASGNTTACTPTFGQFSASNMPQACYTWYASNSPFNVKVPATSSAQCPTGAGSTPCKNTNSPTWINNIVTLGGSTVLNFSYTANFGRGTYFVQPTDTNNWYTFVCGSHSSCSQSSFTIQAPRIAATDASSDKHMGIVNQVTGLEFDVGDGNATINGLPAGGANSGSAVTINLNGSGGSAFCSQINALTSFGNSSCGGGVGGFGFWAGMLRPEDFKAGINTSTGTVTNINAIQHSVFLLSKNTGTNGSNCGSTCTEVFPGGGTSATFGNAPVGSLIWYDVPCSTINGWGIGAFQKLVLCALHNYGGYIGDTGGPATTQGLALVTATGKLYTQAGLADPWPGIVNSTDGCPSNLCSFSAVPVAGSFASHLFVLDQCVAKNDAGQAGGCAP